MTVPDAVLLVEGNDDLHVIANLLQHHNFPEVFEILVKNGIDRILETLPVQLKASGIKRVGIVVDADTTAELRWASIRGILIAEGYHNAPIFPEKAGTIVSQDDQPRFGLWIMPDNKIPGMLEDFAACSISPDDALCTRARRAVEEIPPEHRLFAERHITKAYIHTWLAWQQDPGTPMGLAITKRYLDATAPEAESFLAWLRRLFVTQ